MSLDPSVAGLDLLWTTRLYVYLHDAVTAACRSRSYKAMTILLPHARFDFGTEAVFVCLRHQRAIRSCEMSANTVHAIHRRDGRSHKMDSIKLVSKRRWSSWSLSKLM